MSHHHSTAQNMHRISYSRLNSNSRHEFHIPCKHMDHCGHQSQNVASSPDASAACGFHTNNLATRKPFQNRFRLELTWQPFQNRFKLELTWQTISKPLHIEINMNNHSKTTSNWNWRRCGTHKRRALLVPALSPTAARMAVSVADSSRRTPNGETGVLRGSST